MGKKDRYSMSLFKYDDCFSELLRQPYLPRLPSLPTWFSIWFHYRLKENVRFFAATLNFLSVPEMLNRKIAIQSNDQVLRDLLEKGMGGYLFFPIKAKWISKLERLNSTKGPRFAKLEFQTESSSSA